MQESYAPVVRMRYDIASGDPEKAKNARRHLGPEVQLGQWKFLWTNLSRPAMLLTHSLICFVLSLYMAFIYGIYYLMFATFSGTSYLILRRVLFLTKSFSRAFHPYLRIRDRNLRCCLRRPRRWVYPCFYVWRTVRG